MHHMPFAEEDAIETTAEPAEIRIDDATWASASPERRHEWRVVLDDLRAEPRFSGAAAGRLAVLVTRASDRIVIEARSLDERGDSDVGAEIRDAIAIADLEKYLREYMKICFDMSQLDEGGSSPRLAALDMAKRVVHDDAGRAVQRLLGGLQPDHATGRRLFTLIVTLHFDTSRLVRPHHLDATLERIRHRDGGGSEAS